MPLLELEAAMAARERAGLLNEALRVLTERERVIVLCRQSRTVREVAEDLECSPVAIHEQYHAALQRMRAYFVERGISKLAGLF